MFLCPSAPSWLCHQSLLHPVVGALSCWEYVSWRFEIVNLPHVPKPIGELDLGIRFNLSIFDILNWNATEISSCSLSLEFCVIFFTSSCSSVAVLQVFLKPLRKLILAQGCRHCHGAQIRCIHLAHPCIAYELQQRHGTGRR